jgi:hypothetical protein
MMNPIHHGFKDISQFPFKLAQISQTRRVYLLSKLQSLVFDDVLELYREEKDKHRTNEGRCKEGDKPACEMMYSDRETE